MSEKMKDFYGSVSLTASVGFIVRAKNKEKAENIVFDDIEGMELILKDGTTLEVSEINWDLISNSRNGNVSQPNISDFEIYEED